MTPRNTNFMTTFPTTLVSGPPNRRQSLHLYERLAITEPFWTYFSIFQDSSHAFLLDSALCSGEFAKYSFMGCDPSLIFRVLHHPQPDGPASAQIEVERHKDSTGHRFTTPRVTKYEGDVFVELRRLLAEYAAPLEESARRRFPLLAGGVGYFGYEAGRLIEWLPHTKTHAEPSPPDVYFGFYDTILCHCHQTNETFMSIIGRGDGPAAASDDAVAIGQELQTHIETHQPSEHASRITTVDDEETEIDVNACFDEISYCQAVQEIKQHIYAGDIYQACMTQRFQSPLVGGDAWDLYRELRRCNPTPFACFLKAPEFSVVSASPERYLSVDRDGNAESRPIKGTRPRGETPDADAALRDELSSSIKDQAENIMIVDLVRNDFGRVCQFNSIHVAELMAIESYATVWQMVSTIRGRIAVPHDALDLIRASFPGGSMTGAPKIEAMKILDSLEPVTRGIYSGAIGYLDYGGAIDMNIVIRTFIVENGLCSYGAGGAVVADSDPRAEYLESLDKIRALKSALSRLKAKARRVPR